MLWGAVNVRAVGLEPAQALRRPPIFLFSLFAAPTIGVPGLD